MPSRSMRLVVAAVTPASRSSARREIPREVSTVWAIWRWDMDGGTIRKLGTQELLSEDLYHSSYAEESCPIE